MIASIVSFLLALTTFLVGRHAVMSELQTGQVPKSYYVLVGILFFVGGPLLLFMDKNPFVLSVTSDVLGMLIAGGLVHYGLCLARPLLSGRAQRQRHPKEDWQP